MIGIFNITRQHFLEKASVYKVASGNYSFGSTLD